MVVEWNQQQPARREPGKAQDKGDQDPDFFGRGTKLIILADTTIRFFRVKLPLLCFHHCDAVVESKQQ